MNARNYAIGQREAIKKQKEQSEFVIMNDPMFIKYYVTPIRKVHTGYIFPDRWLEVRLDKEKEVWVGKYLQWLNKTIAFNSFTHES